MRKETSRPKELRSVGVRRGRGLLFVLVWSGPLENLSKGLKVGSELIQTCKARPVQAAGDESPLRPLLKALAFTHFTSEEPLKVSEESCAVPYSGSLQLLS